MFSKNIEQGVGLFYVFAKLIADDDLHEADDRLQSIGLGSYIQRMLLNKSTSMKIAHLKKDAYPIHV